MEFVVIGISYKEADASLRDYSAFRDTDKLEMQTEMMEFGVMQSVIVSTCNRSELYAFIDSKQQLDQLKRIYLQHTSIALKDYVFCKRKKEALLYLFEVCAGYHSLVLGEDQILGQMQDSYRFAQQCGTCKKQMNKVFQTCFSCVKKLKSTYKVSEYPISIAYLAMKNVQQQLDLTNTRVLVIGSGEMARLLITYLKEESLMALYITNRTREHAQQLLTQDNMEIIPFEHRYDILPRCDVIFSATASPHRILKEASIPAAHKPQLFVDLASPRDIDPDIEQRSNITLIDIDHLQKCVDEHRHKRKELLQQAHPLLEETIDQLRIDLQNIRVDATLQNLQQRSEQMAQDTYELLERKLDLNIHERRVLKKVLHTSFLRMVKEPMLALKKAQGQDQKRYMELLQEMLGETE